LDCAISEFCTGDEEEAYQSACFERDTEPGSASQGGMTTTTGGKAYERFWKSAFERALAGREDLEQGRTILSRGPENIVILKEPCKSRLSGRPAAYGRLVSLGRIPPHGSFESVTPVDDNSNQYSYEQIGHGWVQKLVDRRMFRRVESSLESS
jgi:hypothetical protein